MSLAQRSITSASWSLVAGLARTAILFLRSILLARLLPVDTFGVYALAFAIVTASGILARFGTSGAFLHRAPETVDVERAARVHLTFRLLMTALWATLLILAALLFTDGDLRYALIWLTLAVGGTYVTDIPRNILDRRVDQRRLAVIDLLDAILSTIAAVALAMAGFSLVALLVTDLISLALSVVGLIIWRPVWKPRLLWDRAIAAYYFRFGATAASDDIMNSAIDNVDELWTGAVLGQTALGYYARAFTFATYPRRILASPLMMVSGGTYAELKGDRPRLSRAFALSNAWLLRGGFLVSGLLLVIAPEFIRLALGEKWMPMLLTFRLMAVFALLDPIRSAVASLYVAVGRPEQVIRPRLIQLAVLLVAMLALGTRWGIEGVAVAIDLMIVVGTALLLRRAREHVDFSPAALFWPPTLALLVGITAAWVLVRVVCGSASGGCSSDWLGAGLKAGAFTIGFAVVLIALERAQITDLIATVREIRGRVSP